MLSNNFEETLSSSLINVYHYIAEYYEDGFIPATSYSGLTFSSKITVIETTHMMNDDSINI